MSEIARLEPVARGAYTGALGYVSGQGVDLNILIRSFTFAGLRAGWVGDGARTGWGGQRRGAILSGTGYLSGGGGVVIESDPENEYLETRHKVEALLHILGHGKQGVPPALPRVVDSWRPPRPRGAFDGARVVFLENHDSYSYNIVNYLRMLGAEVLVVDQSVAPADGGGLEGAEGRDPRADRPRSGRPVDGRPHARLGRGDARRGLPFLGVCLGHQALGVGRGARLRRAPRPVHGESHLMRHSGRGVLAGIPDPAPFTRYNSLILDDLPDDLTVEARSDPDDGRRVPKPGGADDSLIMAIAHRELPAWGVQFHPESMLSPHGLDLLANFLEMK